MLVSMPKSTSVVEAVKVVVVAELCTLAATP